MLHKGESRSLTAVGRWLLAGSCLATLAGLSQPAMAQDDKTQSNDSAQSSADGIADIIVTARFVAENIQDTPVAITAKTSEELSASNVSGISTLGAVVPNLLAVPGDQQSSGTPVLTLRGVSQGSTSNLAVPPAVAIYTDDIYHATTAGSELDFTDVDHVEVNRGPQSTLSGNASIGGSIKLYTKDPQGDGSGYLSLGYGSRNHMDAAGAIDLALTPTLAMRVSGHIDKQDGYVNRLDFTCVMNQVGTPELAGSLPYAQPDSANRDCVLGQLGGGTSAVGQVKLRWRPTADIDLILTARHSQDKLEETPEVALYSPELAGNTLDAADSLIRLYNHATYNTFGIIVDERFLPPESFGGERATYASFCRPLLDTSYGGFPAGYPFGYCYEPNNKAHHTVLSAKLHARLSDNVNMTAIGGYTNYANEFTQNGDQSPLGMVLSHFNNADKQWSGELRFDGNLFDDKLQWSVGAFALRMDGYQKNMISYLNVFQISDVEGINNSKSGFFHLDYNLTDRWRVSGGARYTDSSIAITIDNPRAVSVLDPVRSIQHRWDWLLSTDYKITDDILIYASAATGSRPAGLTTILNSPRQLLPTPAEDLISYETGIKAEFFDSRLRTNLTAFYMDYNSLSTLVRGVECAGQPGDTATWYPDSSHCAQYAPNTGSLPFATYVGIPAKVKGVEWEITALPIDGLRIDWSGGYNDYKSGAAVGQPGYLTPGNHRQPIWNMHANASYDIETRVGTITPRLDWNWQSQQDNDPTAALRAPRPLFTIGAYSLWNAQLAYVAPSKDWSLTFQVTNLANKLYHYQVFQPLIIAAARVAPPREWNLTLRKDF